VTDPVGRSDVRAGDHEREAAMTALGEHLTAGRISLDEYGDRSAQAAHAQTRGELTALFADLPEPHPVWALPAPVTSGQAPAVPERSVRARRAVQTGVTLMWAVGVPLLFVLGHGRLWWLIFLPIAASIVAGQYLGDDPRRRRRRRR
jgi:hypothetical protein